MKRFVSLNDDVTEVWLLPLVVQTDASFIIHIIALLSLTAASLAQVDKALNGPIGVCFAATPARYEVSQFFFGLFLYFFQKRDMYLKK